MTCGIPYGGWWGCVGPFFSPVFWFLHSLRKIKFCGLWVEGQPTRSLSWVEHSTNGGWADLIFNINQGTAMEVEG